MLSAKQNQSTTILCMQKEREMMLLVHLATWVEYCYHYLKMTSSLRGRLNG